MGIRLEILLEALGNTHAFQYIGNSDAPIFAVQIFQDERMLQNNILYIVDKSKVLPTGIPLGIPALFVEKEQISVVFHHLQRILVQSLKQEFSLLSLRNALLSGEGADQIANICAELMGNPCILFSQELQPMVFSAGLEEDPDLYARLLQSVIPAQAYQDYVPFILDSDPEHKHRSMACFLPKGGTGMRCILFVECLRTFSSPDLFFAGEACKMLLPMFAPPDRIQDTQEKLFLELMENRYLSPFALEQLKKTFRIQKDHSVIYLLLVDTTFQEETLMLQETLSHMVGRKFFRYQHYYATLLSCKAAEAVTYTSIPGFLDFLKDQRLFASLSNGYGDLKKTGAALQQCQEILKIGYTIRKSQHFFRFEDQMIYYMFDMLDDKDTLLNMVHPVVRQVFEYDQQHQTEYLRTLGAYILLEKSTQRCADALYIHRNTMVHRIDKLKTLFNIDFTDSRMRTKLHMSVLIYGYFGYVDLFVQPLITEMDTPL